MRATNQSPHPASNMKNLPMKTLLFCFVAFAWPLAHSKGVPTAGRLPVPEGHKLVHEFMSPGNANGDFTEVFVLVTTQNGYPAASYVVRSNDGKNASEDKSAAVLSDKNGCVNKEKGRMTIYRSNTAPSSYDWTQVVPRRWDTSVPEAQARRFYQHADRMLDIVATEICIATDKLFSTYLQGASSTAFRSRERASEEERNQSKVREEAENRDWRWVKSTWFANYAASSCTRAESRLSGVSRSARRITCRCEVAEIDHPAYRGVMGTTCHLRWQGNLELDGRRSYDGRVEYSYTRTNTEYMENDQEPHAVLSEQKKAEACEARGMKYPCE